MIKNGMLTLILIVPLMVACTPTVKVEAPDKPIEINLNINIEHHVKVDIDKDLQESIDKNKDIF
jgi:hypothetical protein